MGEDTFHKARKYGLDQENFGIFKAAVMDVGLFCLELYIGLIALIWQLSVDVVEHLNWDSGNEIIVSCVFVLISNVLSTFKGLPSRSTRHLCWRRHTASTSRRRASLPGTSLRASWSPRS